MSIPIAAAPRRSIFVVSVLVALGTVASACGPDTPQPLAPAPAPPSASAVAKTAPVASALPPESSAQSALDAGASSAESTDDPDGAPALVAALDKPFGPDERDREKFHKKRIMDSLADAPDPRVADALARFMAKTPSPRWRTQAAFRLAELGDLRAASVLAWRLTQDPMKLYTEADDPELRRDDSERIVAARMLAELATIHPEASADLRATAEQQTLAWIASRPQPHANGLRFLATVKSELAMRKMREWADPKIALPDSGAQSFPTEFATAQSALRYLGRTEDKSAFQVLEKQLHRRPPAFDASQDALMQGGVAVRGMALRAFGIGAIQGFAELRDPRATPLLVKYADDPKENESARIEACFALGALASDAVIEQLARDAVAAANAGEKGKFKAICRLSALARRATPEAATSVAALLGPQVDPAVRTAAAEVLGMNGVPARVAAGLTAQLSDAKVRNEVAVALVLGGTRDAAIAAAGATATAADDAATAYLRAFGPVSIDAYERGDVARWARNADAIKDLDWPRRMLGRVLREISYDNGPRSLTRVRLLSLLARDAKSSDAQKRADARLVLSLMGEKGMLASLGP